jgi:hypothetical protein
MSASSRQKSYRKRKRDEGMVDIRFEVPTSTRDKIRAVATARNSTMKKELQKIAEELARTSVLN